MTNEAFSRVKIDAQLRDQGWPVVNPNAIRYEYVLPSGRIGGGRFHSGQFRKIAGAMTSVGGRRLVASRASSSHAI